MELMMAIGILGIGMVMAASVFPAALKENQLSNDDVIGEMICKNGLNMGKIYYTADTPANKPSEVGLDYFAKESAVDENHISLIPKENQHYPIGDANASMGYALLARKIDDDADPSTTEGYQLVCVAYRKRDASKTVYWDFIRVNPNFDNSGSVSVVTITNYLPNIRVGSPMVFNKTGEYATITKVEGDTVTLNCKLTNRTDETYAYLLLERDELEYSPAIFVMSTRTGLQE
jgi:hypothetical protein